MPGHDSYGTRRFWSAIHPAVRWIRYPLTMLATFLLFSFFIWLASLFD